MLKNILIVFGLLCLLDVQAMASKLEVIANNIFSSDNMVYANDGVMVYYNDTIIKAKKASYNKKTRLLILDENIEMIGYQGTKEYSKHLELKMDTKEATFKELFMGGDNDIWLLTDNAHRLNQIYTLGSGILSSCDIKNPLWKMQFSDALYDQEDEYMKIYNARIDFLGIPLFYTPYIAFSTNKDRSSGFLFPKLAYVPSEGFMYEQPFFWAISKSMDFEINPQIRTKRSQGLYGTFRFVDSNYSKGTVRAGYFKDNETFVKEYGLKNDTHFGFEFNYDSSSVFFAHDDNQSDNNFTDGLYINTTFLNDVDYLNLQKNNLTHFGLQRNQESRFNYFVYNNDYYTGINAKYFIDTSKENNDDTLQILPSFQWHKYLDTLVWDNLTYSIDTHLNNITRKVGMTMRQAEMKVPLQYSYGILDNYLNFQLTNEFYYSKYFFANRPVSYDAFQYYSNIQKISMFSDLTKVYKSTIHVMQPSVEYVNAGYDNSTPVSYEELDDEQKKLFAIGLPEESIDFGLKQYFYDENMHVYFLHRLVQKYYTNRIDKLSELENEMQYIYGDWVFYNYLLYSHEFSEIHTLASSIDLKSEFYNLSFNHTFQKDLTGEEKKVHANDINFDFQYSINKQIRLNGGVSYDIENSESKQWRAGIGYFRDCWSIDVSLQQNIRPTSAGAEKLNSFYLQLNFIPFGGIGTGDFNDPYATR